jgi:hypothetical protein
MDLTTFLQTLGTSLALLASAVSMYIAWKKVKPELRNTMADTDKIIEETRKISAETIAAYAIELKNIKDEQLRERNANKEQFRLMEMEIKQLKETQEKERILYRQFISELIVGITKLTGQIQLRGEQPVWQVPNIPFELKIE